MVTSKRKISATHLCHPMEYTYGTRKGKSRLIQPKRNLNIGQKALSYIGPRLWNDLSSVIKSAENVNVFKHDIKDHFFNVLKTKEDDVYIYY